MRVMRLRGRTLHLRTLRINWFGGRWIVRHVQIAKADTFGLVRTRGNGAEWWDIGPLRIWRESS